MGSFRFRRSIKLGPGVRMNVGKTGIGVSAGVRGARRTFHSSGRQTSYAKTEFDGIASRWANVKGELQDAMEAFEVAKKADLQAIVDMAKQGKSVKDAHARQRKAEAVIADLRGSALAVLTPR